MSQNQVEPLEFPSTESLLAWRGWQDTAMNVYSKLHILCANKNDLYYYFKIAKSKYSLIAVSEKDIFAERAEE